MQRNFKHRLFDTRRKIYTRILCGSARWASPLFKYALSRKISYTSAELALQTERRLGILGHTFNLTEISDQESVRRFRFQKPHVEKIASMISWEASNTYHRRYRVVPVEAVCILLRRLSTPCTWIDLESEFGRHKSALTEIFYHALDLFYKSFHRLIRDGPHHLFVQRAQLYAEAFMRRGSPLNRCIGLIDGTNLRIQRPSGLKQRATFNGHKRFNCLKFQAVVAPDGLILHLSGPIEGRRHDLTMYRESNLQSILENSLNISGNQYYIYGDSAYVLRPYMIVGYKEANPTPEQHQFNLNMSAVRVFVEHAFKDVKQYFSHIDYSRKGKISVTPFALWYYVAAILWNFRVCLYGCPTATHFGCRPPSLEYYTASEDVE